MGWLPYILKCALLKPNTSGSTSIPKFEVKASISNKIREFAFVYEE
jgi:hypothetical protein